MFGDVSMLVVEDHLAIYDSMFAFTANIKDEKKEVTLFYIKDDLDNYSSKKLKWLASMLIDCVCEPTTEKNKLGVKEENQEHELINFWN